MSKIIIHNNSEASDLLCVELVHRVIDRGFLSGDNQYCWMTTFDLWGLTVHAKKTRGTTHTFEVRDL